LKYKIQYKSSVKKDLKQLTNIEANKILTQIENILTVEADRFPLLKGEFKGLRKFRVGDYRVIFTLTKEEVTILKIGHRRDVYR